MPKEIWRSQAQAALWQEMVGVPPTLLPPVLHKVCERHSLFRKSLCSFWPNLKMKCSVDWFFCNLIFFSSFIGACLRLWCWYGPSFLSCHYIFTPVFILLLCTHSLHCIKVQSIKVHVLKQLPPPVGVTMCGDGPSLISLDATTSWLSHPSPQTKRYCCRVNHINPICNFFYWSQFCNKLIVSVIVVCFCDWRLAPKGDRGWICADAGGIPDIWIPVHTWC